MINVNVKICSTKQELQDALFVRNEVFVLEQQIDKDLEIDEHEEICTHFVMYDNDQPIGAGRLRFLSDTEAKVERICVLSSYRGKGYGENLMKKVEEAAQELGASILILNAQDQAVPFYLRLNYEKISDEFFEAGISHFKMQKLLHVHS